MSIQIIHFPLASEHFDLVGTMLDIVSSVNGEAGRVVATILHAAEALDEGGDNLRSRFGAHEVDVAKDSAHCRSEKPQKSENFSDKQKKISKKSQNLRGKTIKPFLIT